MVIGLAAITLGAVGWLDVLVAGLGVILSALIAAVSGYASWQGQRALRARLADERARVGKMRAAQESRLVAWQAEHAARVRAWRALRFAYEQQKRWYAVCVPDGVHRVDVAGGTLSGWSAMLTTVGANRLAAGGEVTVLDLSEGSVGLDLIGFARASGVDPLVWVLPEDLPGLDLGTGLAKDALADLLSEVASVTDEPGSALDLSIEAAILERVIDVLGGQATVASVAAGLRALAGVGDPRDDAAAGLITSGQAEGHRDVRPRRHRPRGPRAGLDLQPSCASWRRRRHRTVPLPAARCARSRGASAGRGRSKASAPTDGRADLPLRETQPGRPGQHTLFVLGADKLRGDTLDRLQRRVRAVRDRAGARLSQHPPARQAAARARRRRRRVHAAGKSGMNVC